MHFEPEFQTPEAGHKPVAEGTILDASTAIMAMNKAEIDIQIATAHAYPRSITRFRKLALELATLDEETSSSMFYCLPRGGKKIEGPSARLAEVVGASWGNLRYGARIVAIDKDFVTAQGACHDLETNNAATVEVKRRITDSKGRRFNDDMIQTTCNAACSIALRQAIFKVVPFAFVKPIYEAARQASIGDAKTMSEKRAAAIDWFKKVGATEKQVLEALGREGIEEVTNDDLITLKGLATAIKEGDTTVEEALGVKHKEPGSKVAESDLNEKLAKAKAAKGVASESVEEKPPVTADPFAHALNRIRGAKTADSAESFANQAKQHFTSEDEAFEIDKTLEEVIAALGDAKKKKGANQKELV